MTGEIERALGDVSVGERERVLLERFVARLLERNAATNLSAARDPEAVAAHVRDSLAIAEFVRGPLIDIGSGGGFPGIPLAIATGVPVTLVESTGKKARFLADVAEELGLSVVVRAERAEDAARDPQLREAFASATARAVSNTCTVLELTVPFLATGGVAVLQRGRFEDAERAAATDAALVLGAQLVEERLVAGVEGGDERRVLLVRKTAPIGQRFPRRAGIPAKRPLCWKAGDGA